MPTEQGKLKNNIFTWRFQAAELVRAHGYRLDKNNIT
jgi:hypothetical protein